MEVCRLSTGIIRKASTAIDTMRDGLQGLTGLKIEDRWKIGGSRMGCAYRTANLC